MTRPDIDEREEEKHILKQTAGEAVVEVVKQGVKEERLTCGADQCVEELAKCPQDVMLCLLPQSTVSQDAAVTIKQVLLRAYCLENEIDLVAVDGEVKVTLKDLVQSCQAPTTKGDSHVTPVTQETNSGLPPGKDNLVMRCPVQESDARQPTEQEMDIGQHGLDDTDGDLPLPTEGGSMALNLPTEETTTGVSAQEERHFSSAADQGSTVQPVRGGTDLVAAPALAPALAPCYGQAAETETDVSKSPGDHADYDCVMIKYPLHDTSQEDNTVAKYVKQELQMWVEPKVTLPDLYQAESAEPQYEYAKHTASQEYDGTWTKADQDPDRHAGRERDAVWTKTDQDPDRHAGRDHDAMWTKGDQDPDRHAGRERDAVWTKADQDQAQSYAEPASPPPDLQQWNLVRLKQKKYKTKGK